MKTCVMDDAYLITSERLGFRNWKEDDLVSMAAINADEEVMEFFPATYNREQTAAFILRMQKMYQQRGYCYFAVERLTERQFIGFTGLAWQEYEAPFTPCTDIGWRLAKAAWGKGYATEGARRCVQYAFEVLKLDRVKATAPLANTRSIHVMEQIGMKLLLTFKHPALRQHPRLEDCACYELVRS